MVLTPLAPLPLLITFLVSQGARVGVASFGRHAVVSEYLRHICAADTLAAGAGATLAAGALAGAAAERRIARIWSALCAALTKEI